MARRRWIFRKPKNYQKPPKRTTYQTKQVKAKYKDKPDPGYKMSRVQVPKERQDGLFSAMVNWLIKVAFDKNRNKGSGGRG